MNKKFFTLLGAVALTSSVMAQGSSTPEYVENGKSWKKPVTLPKILSMLLILIFHAFRTIFKTIIGLNTGGGHTKY
jgi:hypothetical protein